jgi:hypothetical protein
MRYVADRLFEKVSRVDAGDAALGAGAAGLGAVAAAPGLMERGFGATRDALARNADSLSRQVAAQMANPNLTPAQFAELSRASEGPLLRRVRAGKAAEQGRRAMARVATSPRLRTGVGALAGLLGAGSLYGALKD